MNSWRPLPRAGRGRVGAWVFWTAAFVACGDGGHAVDAGGRDSAAPQDVAGAVGTANENGGAGADADLGGGPGTETGATGGTEADGGNGGGGESGGGGSGGGDDGEGGGATAGAGTGDLGGASEMGDAIATGGANTAGSAGIGDGLAGAGGQLGVGDGAGGGGASGACPAGTVSSESNPVCHDPCADLDSDLDGLDDCQDLCPSDVAKVTPGLCGCGHPDIDTDGDTVPDCSDPCPTDPTRSSVGPCGTGPPHVDLTWMTVANVYAEVGPLNVIINGFVTRIPKSNFYGGGGGLEYTYSPDVPDVTTVAQVLAALGGAANVNLLLTGHSHFDHSFDTAIWSGLTGAPIIGSKTTCYQAIAQGIPAARCTEVLGGERIALASGVTMRVIRWNHSGDSSSNPEQHDPVELEAMPIPDAVMGGLRAGVSEDFPNGGGGRAFLFTVDGADGPYSWFFIDSAGDVDLDVPIVVDGVDYGAPLENLKAAMADAKLTGIDLWVGAGGDPVAQLVLPVLNPKAYLPVHWDNFYAAFLSPPGAYSDRSLAATLNARGVNLLTPVQVMDKWRLDRTGVHAIANTAVKQALNFQ